MDPLFDVSGKVFLVAGAGGGIGSALSSMLAERGARLSLTDIDADRVREHNPETDDLAAMAMDITDEGSVAHAVDAVLTRFGRIDGVLNAAGILTIAPALELPEERFQKTFDINLKGPFLLSRVAARAMGPEGGRIVHLASISSTMSNVNYCAYSPSKAALAQLVRVLGREWAPRNITVNAIGPTLIVTGMTQPFLEDPDFHKRYLEDIPLGRFSTPEDLIGTVVMLLSEAGRYITGQTIYVDGGRTLV